MGIVHYSKKEYAEAIKHLNKAVEVLEIIGAKVDLLYPLSYLALCKVRIGEPDSALTIALKLEEQIGLVEAEALDPIILWNASQVYAETAQMDKAKDYLENAYKVVMQRAERVKSEDSRRSFLKNVSENRDIVAAWDRMEKRRQD